MIDFQDRQWLWEDQVPDLVSNKIADVEDAMQLLRQLQRGLQQLRGLGMGPKKGERQAEF
jgi:hypothetical protein